uniref:Peptidase S58 DmpA n=1 Tax=Chromera velia CCMP2878 TaxID=1169474 RepID=A0A0G4FGX9_9ALVE|eukprot:Cvel_16962.t1-p1 / transcript=Cvel_16962.t1 / gene=Cvel_16962 / organism=Chromera_velia_CCMP2878 / gene_product=Uncharacterized protein ML1167, putative / transcript_product=Uncharacterized protein ML1167, putative / location=Cvel_scaffold1331:15600-20389(+) / protein_length=329 / sequence_SO=supercontig / SO=protein_coding / is_pseudo=false
MASFSWLAPSVCIGHTTLKEEQTGGTVFLFQKPLAGAAHLCGCAPATREFAALQPGCSVEKVHGLYLGGGSAFGIDSCAGAIRWLREKGVGVKTHAGPVPVVPGACIFDLPHGKPVPPSQENVYEACCSAVEMPSDGGPRGSVGAGTGAACGKSGPAGFKVGKGGLGAATVDGPVGLKVSAFAVVNAFGDIVTKSSEILCGGTVEKEGKREFCNVQKQVLDGTSVASISLPKEGEEGGGPQRENTTLVTVFTNASMGREGLLKVGKMAVAGLSRSICPALTTVDGDVIFVFSTGDLAGAQVPSPELTVGVMAAEAVAAAVRDGVMHNEG